MHSVEAEGGSFLALMSVFDRPTGLKGVQIVDSLLR